MASPYSSSPGRAPRRKHPRLARQSANPGEPFLLKAKWITRIALDAADASETRDRVMTKEVLRSRTSEVQFIAAKKEAGQSPLLFSPIVALLVVVPVMVITAAPVVA